MAIRTKIVAARVNLYRFGPAKTILKALDRGVIRPLGIHVYRVRVREDFDDGNSEPSVPGILIRELDADELLEATRDTDLRLEEEFVEAAIRRGDRAFGALDNKRLVAYAWRSLSVAPHRHGVWVRVTRPFSYSYKAFTIRGYRGRGIAPALIMFGDVRMSAIGFSRRVGFVSPTNYPSLALGKHIHSRSVGLAGYIRGPGRPKIFHSTAVKKIGFEFYLPSGLAGS